MKNGTFTFLLPALLLMGFGNSQPGPETLGGKTPLDPAQPGHQGLESNPPSQTLVDLAKKHKAYLEPSLSSSPHAQGVYSLTFLDADMTDDDLDHIIETIKASGTKIDLRIARCKKISPKGLKKLSKAEKNIFGLAIKSLATPLTNDQVEFIENLTNLRWLEIDGNKIDQNAYKHVENLTELEQCKLGWSFFLKGDTCLQHMAKMKHLQRLDIGSERLSEVGMKLLPNFREIGMLKIHHAKLTPKAMNNLRELTKLSFLEIEDSTGTKNDGLSNLKTMADTLKKLSIFRCDANDQTLSHLAMLTELTSLHCVAGQMTDQGLKNLSNLENLESLCPSECRNVTGSGFQYVAGLPKLKTFIFAACPVTDDAIVHLKKMKNVKELNFLGTKVTPAALRQLKKERPDLKIRDTEGKEIPS